ncbi:MAG: DUF6125 family protein [Syntrophobacteraceae bacterium]
MSNLKSVEKPEDLSRDDLARLVVDAFHRIIMHYSMWFMETEHQVGTAKALNILKTASKTSYKIQMDRLAKTFGFEMKDGVPKVLADMPKDKLLNALKDIAVNWLANDGVWFTCVESARDMYDAKRCNDTTWTRFSPFEAWSIKQFLGLPEKAGIAGLKAALQFRMYARINVQSIIDEGPDSIIFQMNDCRVQSARKRKKLDDYPCKSAGLVEYSTFAETIDSRIKTECIGCPPDEHPDEWFCAWRFSIPEEK